MNSRPSLADLARYGNERVEDADRELRGVPADDGFGNSDEDFDLDALLDAEMNRA